jgi:RsmE family RNA methyltransferase
MNLVLLFKEDFIEGADRARLEGRRLKHILEVQRATIGDELFVGLRGGKTGVGRITFISRDSLEMVVHLDDPPPPPLPLTLILALPRPKVLRRVVMSASSMGIKKIILLNAYRVEKSFWQSPVLSEANLQKQLILGLEQAKDTVLPEIMLRPLFKPFVEDELPEIIAGSIPILAHPSAADPCPREVREAVTLAIGPEGGFIPFEIEKLLSCGFSAFHVGKRILTVETAVPFIVSRLF